MRPFAPGVRLFHLVDKACQRFFLRLDDFPTRYSQRKPIPGIDLRELTDLARPWWPFQLERVALEGGWIQIMLQSPRLDAFAAGLFHFA